MKDALIMFDADADGYVLSHAAAGTTYRVVVPNALVDDEVGAGTTEETRLEWVRDNLANILTAMTAKMGGGYVKEPWGRIVVVEAS